MNFVLDWFLADQQTLHHIDLSPDPLGVQSSGYEHSNKTLKYMFFFSIKTYRIYELIPYPFHTHY